MYKNHFGGVLAFGVLTVVSLTLLYGAEPGRELVQVNQSLARKRRRLSAASGQKNRRSL